MRRGIYTLCGEPGIPLTTRDVSGEGRLWDEGLTTRHCQRRLLPSRWVTRLRRLGRGASGPRARSPSEGMR